jgi:hypothetical protein
MNEPSVLGTETHVMYKDIVHVREDGKNFEHRDLKNAYGALT